jgi:hypothetical protein
VLAAVPFGILAVGGCATYRDDLARAQVSFEENAHERALATLRVLEPDLKRLTREERARYAYLRGMTDYRIGYRRDGRHWLVLARALDAETPGALPTDWLDRMNDALAELNEAVYAGGAESLPARAPRTVDRNMNGAEGGEGPPNDESEREK